jgi:hypothetical protein
MPKQKPVLKLSVYRLRRGIEEKSCPRCSVREGRYIYYPTSDYGERTLENGSVVPQSWCKNCRNKNGGRRAKD